MKTSGWVLGFFLVLAGVCLAAGKAAGKAAQRTQSVFGVAYTAPDGWVEQVPDMLNVVAAWTWVPKAGMKESAITLRCELAQGDLEKNAATLAERYHGAVRDDKVTMGGEPAKVLWISREGLDVEMRAVVAQHEGLTYVVECTGPVGDLPAPALDAFVANLHFVKREAMWDQLAGDGPAMNVLKGRVSITLPEVMRSTIPPAVQKDDRVMFMLPLTLQGDSEFKVAVGTSIGVNEHTFAELAAAYLNNLNSQSPNAKIIWDKNETTRRLSNMVTLVKLDKAGVEHSVTTMAGIAKLEGVDRYIMVNFIVTTEDPSRRKLYEAAARRIFDSIKPAK